MRSLGIGFLVLGVVLAVAAAALAWWQTNRARTWPREQAQVLSAVVVPAGAGDGSGSTEARYGVRVRLRLAGQDKTLEPSEYSTSYADEALRAERLVQGGSYPLAVNPEDPAESVLDPEGQGLGESVVFALLLAVMGLVCAVFGTVAWASGAGLGLRLLAPSFLGVAVVLGASGGAVLGRAMVRWRWPAVPAEVTRTDVAWKRAESSEADARFPYFYAPRAWIRYQVDGKARDSVILGTWTRGNGAQEAAEQEARGWSGAPALEVRVNPANPFDVERGAGGAGWALLLLGLATLFGVVAWFTRHVGRD